MEQVIYDHEAGQAITRRQALDMLPSVTGKDHWTLAEIVRVGFEYGRNWSVIQAFDLPDGMVATGAKSVKLDAEGIPRYDYAMITVEQHEAANEAERAAQALNDAVTHHGSFKRLADALSRFPGIKAGMSYADIADLMDAYIEAHPASSGTLTAKTVRAMSIFRDELEPAGIVNERFWRALEAVQTLGGGQ